jgi:hypothetical protein
VLEDRIHPLLQQDADMDGALFQDTFDEVSNGSSTGVTCAGRLADSGLHGGSRLQGWTTTAGRSPVATLLMGDGPNTFAHPMFRLLLGNALAWVSSDDAHEQAQAAPFDLAIARLGIVYGPSPVEHERPESVTELMDAANAAGSDDAAVAAASAPITAQSYAWAPNTNWVRLGVATSRSRNAATRAGSPVAAAATSARGRGSAARADHTASAGPRRL